MYRKILVPLDGSALASEALPHAEQVAGEGGAEIVLLHIIDNARSSMLFVAGSAGAGSMTEGTTGPMVEDPSLDSDMRHRESMEAVQEELDKVVDRLKHRGYNASSATDVGDPADCIVDFVDANDIDLVVISTHGRTGLRRWVMGSVSQKVFHHASCPVLIVRPEDQ